MTKKHDSPYLSIISPVYRAEKIIPELVRRIEESVSKITLDYEIILIEDCGPDNSWEVIEKIAEKNNKIIGFKLSKNFGQHYAITCGLDHAQGEWVVVMDCDLQDRPEEIVNLYAKTKEGFDIVFARREIRNDRLIKKLSSKLFYLVFSFLSGIKQDGTVANFGIYSKNAIIHVNRMREPMRAFSPMIRWVGFTKTSINVRHGSRYNGESSYSLKKLLNLAIDISLSYSDKPLKVTIMMGFLISLMSLFFAIVLIVRYYFGYIRVSGYTSLMVSIWFLSGLVILTLGIIGLYVGKIFDGIKNRPLYIISKETRK